MEFVLPIYNAHLYFSRKNSVHYTWQNTVPFDPSILLYFMQKDIWSRIFFKVL